ncbi:MAG: DUF2804 domain-containing protein [Clostridia bacterium]|nr:DUF2804 domain-containing protein [Clostridia bacterium]
MQQIITEKTKLLNAKGSLNQKGYATSLIMDYDRKDIKASKFRIKEWDYYYVGNRDYGVAVTIADNGYMGLLSASILDFNKVWEKTNSIILPFTMGKLKLPSTSEIGDVEYKNKQVYFSFKNDGMSRHLYVKYQNFWENKPLEINVVLTDPPQDSMVIATPFKENPKAFYYNQKINCMKATGWARFEDKEYRFTRENNALGTLDWGRGVWTYKNTWYWGSLSTVLGDETFGFNIGYGFGDTSAATENMLFYKGKAHKLSEVQFLIPKKDDKDDFMSPWTFTSDDGRFEMSFLPIIDRFADTNLKVLRSLQHQVFGLFSGKAILNDGTVITLEKELGFAEKVFNKW